MGHYHDERAAKGATLFLSLSLITGGCGSRPAPGPAATGPAHLDVKCTKPQPIIPCALIPPRLFVTHLSLPHPNT